MKSKAMIKEKLLNDTVKKEGKHEAEDAALGQKAGVTEV